MSDDRPGSSWPEVQPRRAPFDAIRGLGGPRRRRAIPTAVRLVAGLLALVSTGTILLMLPGVGAERRLRFNEAAFTATSALSVTGLSIITPARDLTLLGQTILILLIQVGGVGFMVVAVIAFRLIGRRVGLLDRMALRDSLGLIDLRTIRQIAKRVIVTVLVVEAIGALLLWIHWWPILGGGRAAFYAVFHAVSAFCNAGFDLFTGLPEFPGGLPNDGFTLLVMGTLIFLGGLGIPVIANLLTWPQQRQLSLHTRTTLIVVVALLLAGTLGILVAESLPGGTLVTLPEQRRAEIALFQSVSVRTAGFAAVPSFEQLTPASQMLLIVLMFIGCAPASMGGGITTGTFAVLLVSLWSYARGLPTTQFAYRSIAVESVRKAAAVLTVSLFVVLLATWLIVLTHDATLDEALFEVVSAFATCGLSLAFTAELNPFGQLIIILMMFWGRLGALTIIVALAKQVAPKRVAYPEEALLIG